MEGGHHGVRTSVREGEGLKVLEALGADCGLGHRYQQGVYSNCKTYVHVRGVVTGSERACEEGEESKVLTSRWTPRAGCGLGNRHQQNAYRTCKTYVHGGGSSRVPNEPAREGRSPRSRRADGRRARTVGWATGVSKARTAFVKRTYMERGRHGVLASLWGGGGVHGPRALMDGARGLWAGQQVSAKHDSTCKMYIHGGGSSQGPNEPAGSGRLESRWTARAGCGLGNRH
jgi:hypothetical protein